MTDQPDLDAIEARSAAHDMDDGTCPWCDTVPALVAEVKGLRVKLAAAESLIPNTDEEFPIFPHQLRAAIGARVEDYVLVPAAGLRVDRSADAALAAVERVRRLHRECADDKHRNARECRCCNELWPCPTVRALDPGAEA